MKKTIDRDAATRAIETFLRAIGHDPSSDAELVGTGARVAAAFIDELCDGYAVDVVKLLQSESTVHDAKASNIVILKDVHVTTTCPHHLMPARGKANVAFHAGPRLVGIGALARLVDAYAHRLTLQEAIGENVARALVEHLGAKSAGCRLVMEHACMTARGDRRHDTRVESVSFAGDGVDRGDIQRALGMGEP